MMASIFKPWMLHWSVKKQPVRFVVRGPDKLFHGFSTRDKAVNFADACGSEVYDISKEVDVHAQAPGGDR